MARETKEKRSTWWGVEGGGGQGGELKSQQATVTQPWLRLTHLEDCVEDRVGCHVEDIVLVADEGLGEFSRRFLGEEGEAGDGGQEGRKPDENDQDAGATRRAQVHVPQRQAHGHVALHRHAGQVQRAVPEGGGSKSES